MSMLTLRQLFVRHKATLARLAPRVALPAVAVAALIGPTYTSGPIAARPALEAVSAPVPASSLVATLTANRTTPATATPITPAAGETARSASMSATKSQWQMANIDHPLVDTWVHRFTTSLRSDIAGSLERGSRYVPMISRKLAERGMPQELVYLPLIESNFKSSALSRVSAVGLWQFMAGTARSFGLSVGRHGDERTDPAKATDAALSYLSSLHDRFGSWYLAAAAYNAGPGTVTRAMKHVLGRTTGTDSDFYKVARRLPAETRNYVPKLVAAARIGKNPALVGLAGAGSAPAM